jgi:hypothetical protein
MDFSREIKTLRAETQNTHIEHVRVELNLVTTFIEMSRTERSTGHLDNARASLAHARDAIEAARRGLRNIESQEVRAEFESILKRLEDKLRSQSLQ